MFQSLSCAESTDGAEVGKQLAALRDHLLTLGTTEAKIDALRDEGRYFTDANSNKPEKKKNETSVIEILQVGKPVLNFWRLKGAFPLISLSKVSRSSACPFA